jgi:deoxyribodipyrimidine photo-lyase
VLSLAEVRDSVLGKVQNQADAEKLINELGWRDYWQRLYAKLGNDIWKDQEPYKDRLRSQRLC